MANSTQYFWSVDGVSLQTFAYNITTAGGSKQAPPPLRGSDLKIPYRPGQVFVPRIPDSREITLEMWVIGADADGNIPRGTSRQLYEDNLKMLRNLLWNPSKTISLTKRWKVGSTTYSATAQAVYSGSKGGGR